MRPILIPALALIGLTLTACKDEPELGVEICDNGRDDDGDGKTDCDDPDCAPECTELCDDGIDNDGDGLIDCADEDCFSMACVEICDDGLDNNLNGLIDCADPGCAGQCPEICGDFIDNDGDGLTDCADPDCATTCDADGDGYFSAALGFDDCDDNDPAINPAAAEVCDGIDNDCDGLVDDADPNVVGARFFLDRDGDGYGNPAVSMTTCGQRPPGSVDNDLDCDDRDDRVNPDAEEICNGIDDNCNGLVDGDDPSVTSGWYVDADLDGFGDAGSPLVPGCGRPPAGFSSNNLDCDDSNPNVNPSRREQLCNGLDDDCDPSTIDDADVDRDGFTICGGDCNDRNPNVNPDQVEVPCNGLDDDCDPATIDALDLDGDGFSCLVDCDDADPDVNPGQREIPCNGLDDDCDPNTIDDADDDEDGFSLCDGDCDDNNAAVNHGQVEIECNGLDDDCDAATIDQVDRDGDGLACDIDCDDDDPLSGPLIAEGYLDADGDGYGVGPLLRDCEGTLSLAPVDGDCDDTDPGINPGAPEVCNDGIDQDCSGADCMFTAASFTTWGEHRFAVPAGVTELTVRATGAGGGGADPRPWSTGRGGAGAFVEATVPVVAGDVLVVVVGRGGSGVSCGGGTPGAGGGGFSGLLDATYAPLVVAGGGGGGAEGATGCDAGGRCSSVGVGLPANGYGAGGGASDPSATPGRDGGAAPAFLGGLVGAGNCGSPAGEGGYGGGGGGGGTRNGFGGGGGGGGFPGGLGGASGFGGFGGSDFLHPSATLLGAGVGADGGPFGGAGIDGSVELEWGI